MSIPTIVLNTDKNTSNISNDKITIRQSERGLVLTAVIKDKDGTNYDLSDKHVQFAENKDGQKIIVDENVQVDSAPGTIHYTLNSNVYSASGEAWFEIINSGNSVIDSTNNFNIVAIEDAQSNVSNDNYISSLNSLMAHIKYVSDTAQGQIDAVIKSLNNQINQAISNGQRDVANELTDMRNQLQALHNQENGLIQSWTNDFNARKADFDKLKADWQAQSKTISDSYASKIAEINSQTQSQHDQIQTAADQQLQANQSASDAELAKIKSDAQAQHDQIEKAKNDAIAEITSQRDAAINQANSDFKAKIDALQTDYDAWKSTTLADFTKQLADIKTNISNDQSTLKDFDQQLDYTKQELADMAKQLDSLDFAKFVTGDQFKDAMTKKASGIKVQGLGGDYIMAVDPSSSLINAANGSGALADTGVIGAALQVVADAILDKNHYTKVEVDALMDSTQKKIQSAIDAKANNSDLTSKADKSQIESLNNQLTEMRQENTQLKSKVDTLTTENTTLKQQVTKLTPVHVSSVDDVARQDSFFVIVDD